MFGGSRWPGAPVPQPMYRVEAGAVQIFQASYPWLEAYVYVYKLNLSRTYLHTSERSWRFSLEFRLVSVSSFSWATHLSALLSPVFVRRNDPDSAVCRTHLHTKTSGEQGSVRRAKQPVLQELTTTAVVYTVLQTSWLVGRHTARGKYSCDFLVEGKSRSAILPRRQ